MKSKNNKKQFNVSFRLCNVEAESANAVAEMVMAFASMLGIVLKQASAELVGYLHTDGVYYPYRQRKGRGMVYQVVSRGPSLMSTQERPLPYFIYLPPGREMCLLDLTHDHDRSDWEHITPHWGDLRKLPRSARIWLRLENELEPSWHRVGDALHQTTLPARLIKSSDCLRS